MSESINYEPLLDMFLFETSHNIEQLEASILSSENSKSYTSETIGEIFRVMHTIKGSAALMMFHSISSLAHSMEDLFYFIRGENPPSVDSSALSDLVLEGLDWIKGELEKIRDGRPSDGDAALLIEKIQEFLLQLKNPPSHSADAPAAAERISAPKTQKCYKAVLRFEEGCELENFRAFMVTQALNEISDRYTHIPEELMDNEEAAGVIRENGFSIQFRSACDYDEVHRFLMETILLKELQLTQLNSQTQEVHSAAEDSTLCSGSPHESMPGSMISVKVSKLDKLMDLMGEMVIAEAMVTQNPDLGGMALDNFRKAAVQLRKITNEMQDTIMSIRMVPIGPTFQKMQRVVRDMGKKLNKQVRLELIGEETEVDKNIIEHISDPLMHLVRNAADHGIEDEESRHIKGKPEIGRITLEAKNSGGDVLIVIRDDGRGMDRGQILNKAKEKGLIIKPEQEMSDKEVFNLILLPGFSTKETVSEFSGRGVGMDVVARNIEGVGGSVSIDSKVDFYSEVTLKIPLTLAIIDGMNIQTGKSLYTIPTTAIKESFRPNDKDIVTDPDGNEMILVRGRCYPILSLYEYFKVKAEVSRYSEGIFLMVEQEDRGLCIFADRLLGQQQVVVKALPDYISSIRKIKGLSGCSLLGDGSISLIIDINSILTIAARYARLK